MSWFRGALDKVKEKSVVVRELAKDVVIRTKEVRARMLRSSTSVEELQVSFPGHLEEILLYLDAIRKSSRLS